MILLRIKFIKSIRMNVSGALIDLNNGTAYGIKGKKGFWTLIDGYGALWIPDDSYEYLESINIDHYTNPIKESNERSHNLLERQTLKSLIGDGLSKVTMEFQ